MNLVIRDPVTGRFKRAPKPRQHWAIDTGAFLLNIILVSAIFFLVELYKPTVETPRIIIYRGGIVTYCTIKKDMFC